MHAPQPFATKTLTKHISATRPLLDVLEASEGSKKVGLRAHREKPGIEPGTSRSIPGSPGSM